MAMTEPRTAPSLGKMLREWGRIGATGFGGPATHVKLLRDLCVSRHDWIEETQFERALAAVNVMPGPASTQLAIYCAWHLRGSRGALIAGACFIAPGLILVIALSALFLSHSPPLWVRGAGMGAGAAVPAVAVLAGSTVAAPMWRRLRGSARVRAVLYALAGGAAAASLGPWLVLVLLACGAIELGWTSRRRRSRSGKGNGGDGLAAQAPLRSHWLLASASTGGLGALAWTSLKVGALAFGGGFVIVPLMQADAVHTYHWMTHSQFLNAVALGQVTPGPVTQTVAAVGYAAHGLTGAVLAALIAYSPSFAFILLGASGFERLLENERVLAFLAGAAPAAAGAIIGAAIPLTEAIAQTWQYFVLAGAAVALLVLRRGIVQTLLAAGAIGTTVALLGGPVSS